MCTGPVELGGKYAPPDFGTIAKSGKICSTVRYLIAKSDNLQYNMLGHWVSGTIVSLTKRLMFQVLFLFHNFLQKSIYFFILS